jgi:hypothetical protein
MIKNIYLIYIDSMDNECNIKGYIIGTEEDAKKYCELYKKDEKNTWEHVAYQAIQMLPEWKEDVAQRIIEEGTNN